MEYLNISYHYRNEDMEFILPIAAALLMKTPEPNILPNPSRYSRIRKRITDDLTRRPIRLTPPPAFNTRSHLIRKPIH
jgi:hypothetical protein